MQLGEFVFAAHEQVLQQRNIDPERHPVAIPRNAFLLSLPGNPMRPEGAAAPPPETSVRYGSLTDAALRIAAATNRGQGGDVGGKAPAAQPARPRKVARSVSVARTINSTVTS